VPEPTELLRENPHLISGVALIVFAVALSVRLWQLSYQPPHPDELRQLREVAEPWSALLGLSYNHQQPPLAYVIDKLVLAVSGPSDFWQRLPAAVFGSGAVALVSLILGRAGCLLGAIVAPLLLVAQPLLVEYSRYTRPYSLPVFAALLALFFYLEWLRGRHRWASIAFTISICAALASRPLMPLIFTGVLILLAALYAIRQEGMRRPLQLVRADPLGLLVAPLAILLVWLPNYLAVRAASGTYLRSSEFDLGRSLQSWREDLAVHGERALLPIPPLWIFVTFVVVVFLPGVIRALRKHVIIWLPVFAVGPIFALAHSLFTRDGQFFTARYLIFLPFGIAILLSIAADAALRSLRLRALRLAAVAVLASTITLVYLPATIDRTIYTSTTPRYADWRAMGMHLQEVARDGDAIVAIQAKPFAPDEFYSGFEAAPRYYRGPASYGKPQDYMGPLYRHQALTASRYHFVIINVTPDLVSEESLPPGWEIERDFRMWTVTTSLLHTDAERAEAWWRMALFLADPVSIYTRLAGYGLAREAGVDARRPWTPSIVEDAELLGQGKAARQLIQQLEVETAENQ
jgi:hypothetical protein